MIRLFTKLDEFKKHLSVVNDQTKVDEILKIDFPFFENQEKYTMINIPCYSEENPHNLLFLSKDYTFVYSSYNYNNYEKIFKKIIKKPYGESTAIIFLTLKHVLKNYAHEFEKIRVEIGSLDLNPVLDDIERSGRALRRLTDRMEELVQLIIVIKEEDIREFDTALIPFEHEILTTEARYWLERCRSHMYRIASLRTKSEINSNRELNDIMKRLTVIITFLTIVSIVVSVPGSIGAIFGIPALSDAYFRPHTTLLVFSLMIATALSVILGYLYWRSLKLTK